MVHVDAQQPVENVSLIIQIEERFELSNSVTWMRKREELLSLHEEDSRHDDILGCRGLRELCRSPYLVMVAPSPYVKFCARQRAIQILSNDLRKVVSIVFLSCEFIFVCLELAVYEVQIILICVNLINIRGSCREVRKP